MSEADAYLVWSTVHQAWWRPQSAGYTVHLYQAGIYSRDEAIAISRTARDGWVPGRPPTEIPVRFADVHAASQPVWPGACRAEPPASALAAQAADSFRRNIERAQEISASAAARRKRIRSGRA